MMKKIMPPVFLLLFYAFSFAAAMAAEDIKVVLKDRQAALSYQAVDEGNLSLRGIDFPAIRTVLSFDLFNLFQVEVD